MKWQKGQSLFEAVLVIGIMAVILVGIVILSTSSIRNSIYSRNKTLSERYAQEAVEWLRSQRDTSYANLSSHIGTSCLSDLSWAKYSQGTTNCPITNTLLTRSVSLTEIDTATILATVTVYWRDGQGKHQVRSMTYFTDWRQR